jgi:rubrerythrin
MSKLDGVSWSIDDIPYDQIAPESMRDNRQLFEIVASASFIEITSDLYTSNLVEFFRDDSEIAGWLEHRWEKEEMQHGAALKKYVQTAWPDFDWEGAYRTFQADYGPLCTVEKLAKTRALEMAARCVVETGTASFYRMVSEVSPEPVLKRLAAAISTDEVRHYKHFHRYFRRYQQTERLGRLAVLRTLVSRAAEVEAEDTFCAYKAVFTATRPGIPFERRHYDAYRDGVLHLVRYHFPHGMAVKMILKPLGLGPMLGRATVPAVTSATRLFLRRYDKAA